MSSPQQRLMEAVENNDDVGAEQLLKCTPGINVNLTDGGITPLTACCYQGNVAIARLLIDQNANVDEKDSDGEVAPLHIASNHGYVELMQLLLMNDADGNIRDDSGRTPLHYATEGGELGAVELLLNNESIIINCRNIDGDTPLHMACNFNQIEIINLLLNNGADIDSQNNRGLLPDDLMRLVINTEVNVNDLNTTWVESIQQQIHLFNTLRRRRRMYSWVKRIWMDKHGE